MAATKVTAMIVGALTVLAGVFVVALLVIKVVWAWTVPDLFPGAVAQGLVAGSISWLTALKLAVLVAILSGAASGAHAQQQHS